MTIAPQTIGRHHLVMWSAMTITEQAMAVEACLESGDLTLAEEIRRDRLDQIRADLRSLEAQLTDVEKQTAQYGRARERHKHLLNVIERQTLEWWYAHWADSVPELVCAAR